MFWGVGGPKIEAPRLEGFSTLAGAAQVPPGPRSVGCERVTDPWGQPDPAKPHCGFWCATGPAPMAHRGLGVLWGCGGAPGVAMWWATRWVTGVRPSPRWGRFVTPVTAHGGCGPP